MNGSYLLDFFTLFIIFISFYDTETLKKAFQQQKCQETISMVADNNNNKYDLSKYPKTFLRDDLYQKFHRLD